MIHDGWALEHGCELHSARISSVDFCYAPFEISAIKIRITRWYMYTAKIDALIELAQSLLLAIPFHYV